MLEIINFVFPISASMASSSRWGSYSDSADDGCLEKFTDPSLILSSDVSLFIRLMNIDLVGSVVPYTFKPDTVPWIRIRL